MTDAKVNGVGEKLLKTVQKFFLDSGVCARVGNDVSECFRLMLD